MTKVVEPWEALKALLEKKFVQGGDVVYGTRKSNGTPEVLEWSPSIRAWVDAEDFTLPMLLGMPEWFIVPDPSTQPPLSGWEAMKLMGEGKCVQMVFADGSGLTYGMRGGLPKVWSDVSMAWIPSSNSIERWCAHTYREVPDPSIKKPIATASEVFSLSACARFSLAAFVARGELPEDEHAVLQEALDRDEQRCTGCKFLVPREGSSAATCGYPRRKLRVDYPSEHSCRSWEKK